MSITSHIQNLKQKHEKLSSEVEQAYKSPALDELYISQLKKEKLRLKEMNLRASRELKYDDKNDEISSKLRAFDIENSSKN